MQEQDMIKQRMDLLGKEIEINNKTTALEFERIAKAFSQFGNLIDLLYLEVTVLIDLLAKKTVINEKEFSELLETTAKKIREEQSASESITEPKTIEKL